MKYRFNICYAYQLLFILAAVITAVIKLGKSTLLLTVILVVNCLACLIIVNGKETLRLNVSTFVVISFGCYYMVSSSVHKNIDRTSLITMLFILLLYLCLKGENIKANKLLKFINVTYLVYFIFSVCMYFIYYTSVKSGNQFLIKLPWFSYRTLVGVSGTTANIDSYSVMVLMINMLYGKNNILKVIFVFVIIWTARMTPIVGFVGGCLSYFIGNSKKVAVGWILAFFGTFVMILLMIHNCHDVLIFDLKLSHYLYHATHGRNLIWEKQLARIVNEFSVMDYIFGNFDLAEVEVYWSKTENSHNAFLFNFFRFGSFSIAFLLIYLIKFFKNYDKKKFTILMTVFVFALTNSEILLPYNPVYLIVLISILFIKEEDSFENNKYHNTDGSGGRTRCSFENGSRA